MRRGHGSSALEGIGVVRRGAQDVDAWRCEMHGMAAIVGKRGQRIGAIRRGDCNHVRKSNVRWICRKRVVAGEVVSRGGDKEGSVGQLRGDSILQRLREDVSAPTVVRRDDVDARIFQRFDNFEALNRCPHCAAAI